MESVLQPSELHAKAVKFLAPLAKSAVVFHNPVQIRLLLLVLLALLMPSAIVLSTSPVYDQGSDKAHRALKQT